MGIWEIRVEDGKIVDEKKKGDEKKKLGGEKQTSVLD